MDPQAANLLLSYDQAPDLLRDTVIRSIKARILDVPTIRKHKLSNTAISQQNYVHVEVLFDNGMVGCGEASTLGGPRWAEESVESIKANIDAYIAPPLIGQPGCRVQAANATMAKAAKRNFAAKSALNTAILDALAKSLQISVATLLGGVVRNRFSVIWALASGDVGQELEEAQAKIAARQFNRFKIKLGFSDARTDLARLTKLRQELPDDTEIVADINQAWTEADFFRWLPALEELNLSLIEQPLDADDLDGMVRISRRSRTPIMLDEGVFTPTEAQRGTAAAAGSVLSLKLCKHGSAQGLQQVAGIASSGGLELYGGCLLESSLGAAAHLAVFATLPDLKWGTEHFGPLILSEDTTTESLVFKDFHVHLPVGQGLGVTPDPDKIKAFARKG